MSVITSTTSTHETTSMHEAISTHEIISAHETIFANEVTSINATIFTIETSRISVITSAVASLKTYELFDSCKKQEFKIIEKLRLELRQAIRSSKLERSRKESVSIILQFDQRYTQQIEIFNRSLSNSYD